MTLLQPVVYMLACFTKQARQARSLEILSLVSVGDWLAMFLVSGVCLCILEML